MILDDALYAFIISRDFIHSPRAFCGLCVCVRVWIYRYIFVCVYSYFIVREIKALMYEVFHYGPFWVDVFLAFGFFGFGLVFCVVWRVYSVSRQHDDVRWLVYLI